MRSILLIAGLAACSFSLSPAPAVTGDATADSPIADAPIDAFIAVDACATCPANDVPGGAISITGSLVLSASFATAHDDITSGCGAAGGRDLFYELVVPVAQVVYLDTAGSTIDATLTLYPGSCTAGGPALKCVNDPCAPATFAQLGQSLAAGTYCLVVDEGAATAGSMLVLDVSFLGRDGTQLTGTPPFTASGDTCTSTDVVDPSCENLATSPGTAKDQMYWFTQCGGSHTVTASTCVGIGYDSIVSVMGRTGSGACVDDGCPVLSDGSVTTLNVNGTGVVRVIVDGWNGACGTYNLSVTP